MLFGEITQKIYNIDRLRQILQVLAKYGFGYVVHRLKLDQSIIPNNLFRFGPMKRLEIFDLPVPVRARRVLEELGPAFIKLGQILSTRPDIIPLEFCKEFEKLQDKVPPFEFKKVEEVVESELKRPINEIFNNFSQTPVAAASLSQVHYAELKSGEKVVVKVQRPNIKKVITTDLKILEGLVRLIEKHMEESRVYNPVGIVNEFQESILKEMDFNAEATHVVRFQLNFKDNATVYVPKIFHQVSTGRVLTLERIEGTKITDKEQIGKLGLDRKQIAVNGANAILKQIFIDGFFHADPHPGNIFVTAGNRIVFIDYGMVGRIDEETKDQLANILTAIIERDVSEISETFLAMGMIEDVDVRKLNLGLAVIMDSYYGLPLKDLRVGPLLVDIVKLVTRYKLRIPPDLFLLAKTVLTIESVGKSLYPDFNMTDQAKPFVESLLKSRYSPKKIAKEIRKFAKDINRLRNTLPKDINLILNKIKKGTLKIDFEHKGLENLILHMDKVSNRIGFSVIIAALVIGSSIIMQTDKGPLLLGFPVLGIIGFIVASFLGLGLAIGILRSGRL
ncbi:MAG: AarF/UbiB family protein [Candidatus Scalindua sp.]|nr:AarF/UbiB family protein [Candidatus Scalindua sp.]